VERLLQKPPGGPSSKEKKIGKSAGGIGGTRSGTHEPTFKGEQRKSGDNSPFEGPKSKKLGPRDLKKKGRDTAAITLGRVIIGGKINREKQPCGNGKMKPLEKKGG